MKKKIRYKAIVLCAVILLAAGCAGETDEAYKTIVEDYAQIILQQDQDSAAYDRALEAVGAYLEQPEEPARAEAETLVLDTIEQMEEDSAKCVPYELGDDFSELLKSYGIEPEEYCINAEARAENLSGYINNLEYLAFHLEKDYASEELKELEFGFRYFQGEQKDYRGYHYCGINYWFAGWEEEQVEYVRTQLLDRLESFSVEEAVWEKDRDEVERRMNLYLDNIEERAKEWAEVIGDHQEELDQLLMNQDETLQP